jgi:hypothetical protein
MQSRPITFYFVWFFDLIRMNTNIFTLIEPLVESASIETGKAFNALPLLNLLFNPSKHDLIRTTDLLLLYEFDHNERDTNHFANCTAN